MARTGLDPVGRSPARAADVPAAEALRSFAIAAGLTCAALFVLVGVCFGLQRYADGSIFSYAVAVRDVWAFHWHNISGRSSVYLLAMLPAEGYVRLTGDPDGGIVCYGLLFFSAQLAGLLVTWKADRSPDRLVFAYACFSTACICPLVFGFPTEMWLAHALFWPTLAAAHYARRDVLSFACLFPLMLAMMLSHEGALIYAVAILVTLGLRGFKDHAFLRGVLVFAAALAVWFWVKADIRPDSYIAPVLERAAFEVFSLDILTGSLMRLLSSTLALYAFAFWIAYLLNRTKAHVYAAALVAAALAAYWLFFDRGLHADQRYYLRTVVVVAAPVFAGFAAYYAILREDRLAFPVPFGKYLAAARTNETLFRFIAGAFFLVLLVHAVESVKFVSAWNDYTKAVRALAAGDASDPKLGDPRFVSTDRLPARLKPLAWFSTTPYLSALLAPGFNPRRLVVDPADNYFWLSCETATENAKSARAFPAGPRELIRVFSCLHRN